MRGSKSIIWKYFEKTLMNNYAICTICKKEYCTSGNTSNLRKHLLQLHKNDIAKEHLVYFHTNKTETSETESTDRGNESGGEEPPIKKKKQKMVNDFFQVKSECYSTSHYKKIKIDEKLALMVARDMQPFSLVRDEGFLDLMNTMDPRYMVPCSNFIKNLLNMKIYDKVYANLQSALNSVSWVSLTTDLWTSSSNTESYCTITCHFIEGAKMQSAVLQTVNLSIRHTSENLKEHIQEVIDKFNLGNKITCIVSDNASNMKLCCSLLHISHFPCFAHSLNLVVEDAISAEESFHQIINKVKSIVTYFKKSNVAMDLLRDQQKKSGSKQLKLLQDVATRWNSVLFMIRRILEIGDDLTIAIIHCPKAPPQILGAEELLVLKEAVMALEIFEKATVQLSADSYPTISLVIPLVLGMTLELNELESKLTNDIAKNLLNLLKQGIVKRLFPYELRVTPKLASLLDPRIKKMGFRLAENATSGQELLQDEMVRMITSHRVVGHDTEIAGPSTSTNESSSEVSLKENEINLLKFLVERKTQVEERTPKTEAIISTRQYFELPPLNMDSDPLEYWRTHTQDDLFKLAKKYLCVPATSVSSERIFSKAGILISNKRSRLKSNNVNKIIFVNKNYTFLNR